MVILNPLKWTVKINHHSSTEQAHSSVMMQDSVTTKVLLVFNNPTLLTSPKAKSPMRLKTLSI